MGKFPDIKITVTDNAVEFGNLKDVWDHLVENADGMTIFQTYDWNYCWWQAYGDEHELLILKIESGGEIIGIAPLMKTGNIVEFIGTPNADYSDFITIQPGPCIAAVVDFLGKSEFHDNKIVLSQIPENSGSLPVLEKALMESRRPYRLYPIENVMAFRYDGGDAERAGFELHRGGTIRKFLNFFNKMGGLSLTGFNTPLEILERLPDFYHSHIVWWFRRGGDGCKFLNPKVRRFHDLAAHDMAGEGRVRLYVLLHGRQPLAYLYAFVYRRTIYLYQIASLMNYRKKSPGILLLQLLVESAVREGFDVIDFSRGAGEHKERFANQTGRNMQCTIYTSGLKKNLAAVYFGLKESAAGRMIKAMKPVRTLKNRMGGAGRVDYFHTMNATSSLLFAGKGDWSEVEYYWKESAIAMEDVSPEPIRSTELVISDMEKIAAFVGIEIDSEEYADWQHRFETGGRCFMALCEGHPAALGWILTGAEISHENATAKINDKPTGFIADLGISPVYDTPGLRSAFYRFLYSECGKLGLDALVACIRDDRELAATLMEMGFRRL